jgi:hypothetical protein
MVRSMCGQLTVCAGLVLGSLFTSGFAAKPAVVPDTTRYGVHYSVWTGIAADVQHDWLYGFVSAGSDLALAPWLVFSALDSSAGASAAQNSNEITSRWEVNGIGSGISGGIGPTFAIDDARAFNLDILTTVIYSRFYKGGYAFSPGLLLGIRIELSEHLEIGVKIPLFGWAFGELYTADNRQQLTAIPSSDAIPRFFSNTLVATPLFTVGYRF